jgi:glucosamine 6-phosphate synthetase-like amidotransferase/phosphosugar isomerase protein
MAAIKTMARVTMTRGPHAWGMAWLGRDGRLRMYKQTGRVVDALGLLMMAAGARFLIGHCRYATHGRPEANVNNHPHPADGGWVVHNGVIHGHELIASSLGREAVTRCDSEVLGMLIEEGEGRLMERCADASDAAGKSPLVMLGLWKPGRLVAVRRGNPLHLGTTDAGHYIASLPDGLPGRVREVEDRTVTEFTKAGAEYAEF